MNEEFHRAKEALLKYYSDVQVSLGARLVGLIVGLFALLEVFKNFSNPSLLQMLFQVDWSSSGYFVALKGFIFYFGVGVLLVIMIRTIFRYAAVSGFCNELQVLEPFQVSESVALHGEMASRAYSRMLLRDNGKPAQVIFFFPFT